MTYLGDYLLGATVDFKWSTVNSSGASITRSTNGTINVYKSNDLTQRTAGIVDTEDFDFTGIHHCSINTTDGFYIANTDYQVVLSAATIDTQTVNAVIGHFSIQNRSSSLDITSLTNLIATFDGTGYGFTNSTIPIVTTLTGHTPQTGDSYTLIGNSGVGLTHLAESSICTNTRLAELDSGNLPNDISAIPTTAMRGTDNSVLATSIGFAGVGLTHLAISSVCTDAFDTVIPGSPTTGSVNDVLDRQEEATIKVTASGTPGLTSMASDLTVNVASQYNGRILTFRKDTTTANLRGQQTNITSSLVTGNILVYTSLATAPVSGDIAELT